MPRRSRTSRSRATSNATQRSKPEAFAQLLELLNIARPSRPANDLRETLKELAREYLDLKHLPSRQPSAFTAIKKELPNRLPALFSSSLPSRRSSQTKSPKSSRSSSPSEDDEEENREKIRRASYLALQAIGRLHLSAQTANARSQRDKRKREEEGRFLVKDFFESESEPELESGVDLEEAGEEGLVRGVDDGGDRGGEDVLELTDDDEGEKSDINATPYAEPAPSPRTMQPKSKVHNRMITTPPPDPEFELDLDDFPRIVHSPTPQSSPGFSMTLRSAKRRRGVQSASSRTNENYEPRFNIRARKVNASASGPKRTASPSHSLTSPPGSVSTRTPGGISFTTMNETLSSWFLPVWKIDPPVTSGGGCQQNSSTRRRPLVASTRPNADFNLDGASTLAEYREWCSPNENSSMAFSSLAQAEGERVEAGRSPTTKSTTSSSSKLASYSRAPLRSPSVRSSTNTGPSTGAQVVTEQRALHSFLSTCSPPAGMAHLLPNFIAYGCTTETHLRSLSLLKQDKKREVLRRIVVVRNIKENTNEVVGSDGPVTRGVQNWGTQMDLDLLEDHLGRCFGCGYGQQ